MKRAAGFLCVVVLAATPASANNPTAWYTIVADSGAKLGHVSLEVETRADGRDLIETQQIYLRERGGAANRTRARTIVREDSSGRVLTIESTSRTGRFWSRT